MGPVRHERRSARRLGGLLALGALSAALLPGGTASAGTWVAADDGAAIVSQTTVDTHMFDVTVTSPDLGPSPALKAEVNGKINIRVLVPPDWTPTATRTWPVVYAYQGGIDDYLSWTTKSTLEAEALHYDAMVVMPEGGVDGSYTDWYNFGAGGIPKWESFHLKEVTQLMERNFHAGTTRAAMGLSSGGQGALAYAARNPGMFKYVASYSGLVHITDPTVQTALMVNGTLFPSATAENPYAIWGFPFLNQSNWNAHDPYMLAAGLRGVGLYLSSGTTGLPGPLDNLSGLSLTQLATKQIEGGTTEQMVGSTNQALISKLKWLGIPVTTDIYGNGWHTWPYWNMEMLKSYPLIMSAIGAPQIS